MSCCGNNNEPPVTGYSGGTLVLNHSNCEGITIDLLNMWLRIITCTRDNNSLDKASVTLSEAESAIALLNTWIEAKQQDPGSCEHQEKLPVIQVIINKTVAYGQC